MKTNLKKKLAPYTIKKTTSQLEAEGKAQIEAALKNKGMEPDEILGNNAEPIPNYPDDEPNDNYDEDYDDRDGADEIRDARIDWDYTHKDKFLDEYMEGRH